MPLQLWTCVYCFASFPTKAAADEHEDVCWYAEELRRGLARRVNAYELRQAIIAERTRIAVEARLEKEKMRLRKPAGRELLRGSGEPKTGSGF